jgi:hypothetical protein
MTAIQGERGPRLSQGDREGVRVPPEARAEIEAVLTALRQWLLEAAVTCDEPGAEADAVAAAELTAGEFDASMHGLFREWIALRREIERAAGDNGAAREVLARAAGLFERGGAEMKESVGQLLAPLVRDRDRIRDDLRQRLQVQQSNWLELILDLRAGLAEAEKEARAGLEQLGWRRRLLPGPAGGAVAEALASGLSRIDSALDSRGVRRVAAAGGPVDLQTMRVVETAEHEALPAGHVIEVLRPGFVCGREVVRFAEVRATPSAGSADE